MMFHATQPLTCGSCVRINPEPGWLIDASGVLGEPALPRGLPNWRRFQGAISERAAFRHCGQFTNYLRQSATQNPENEV